MIVGICLVAFSLLLNLFPIFKQDILFHTDIARDFLVMDEIVETKKFTLIGPRSGGVSGVFHGPAWYYLNLPVFILSDGDPAVIGIWWFFLFHFALVVAFFALRNVFEKSVAWMTIGLFSILMVFSSMGFGQQSPVLFLAFYAIFSIWKYLSTKKIRWLISSILLLGLLIQFQMAFGVPITILSFFLLTFYQWKNNNIKSVMWWFLIIIPLSTFVIFDLRHDFLQLRSVLAYFQNNSQSDFNFVDYLRQRMFAFFDSLSLFRQYSNSWSTIAGGLIGLITLILALTTSRKINSSLSLFSKLSIYFMLGFWMITLPFKGAIWSYYYEGFWLLITGWIVWYVFQTKAIWIKISFLIIVGFNLYFALQRSVIYWQAQVDDHEIYWSFYRQMAKDIFEKYSDEFGYYVFTMDQYGYQAKYGLKFQAKNLNKIIHNYQKKPKTVLIIGRNDNLNPYANEKYWQKEQVKIDKEPLDYWKYPNGYQVAVFDLTLEEQKISSDSNLIDGLQFR